LKNIKFNDIKHIYFCGIGGISMSGLARVLFEKDFEVSGSDTKANNRTKDLEDRGVKIFVGQKSENISDEIDLFVYTAAIHNDNPEFIAAKEKNIKMMTRAELLGYVMSKFKESIAISGTHGKTTTTSMLSYILLDTKLDPTISVGGIVKKIKGNIKRIAISPGSGRGMYKYALGEADVLITGDITHHEGLDAINEGICIIDATHYGLEHVFTEKIVNDLKKYSELNVFEFKNTNPVEIM